MFYSCRVESCDGFTTANACKRSLGTNMKIKGGGGMGAWGAQGGYGRLWGVLAQRSLFPVGLSGKWGSYWSAGQVVHEQGGTAHCQWTLGFLPEGPWCSQAGYLGPGSAGVLAPCRPEPLLHILARGQPWPVWLHSA